MRSATDLKMLRFLQELCAIQIEHWMFELGRTACKSTKQALRNLINAKLVDSLALRGMVERKEHELYLYNVALLEAYAVDRDFLTAVHFCPVDINSKRLDKQRLFS